MRRLTNESRDSRNSNAVRIYCDVETALDRLYKLEDIINECHIDSLEELKVRLKQSQSKIRTPELEDRYFFIQSTGQVRNCFNTTQNRKNKGRIETGNFFETRGEAEMAAYRRKYTNLFKKYVEAHSQFVDWGDIEQPKWSLNFDRTTNKLNVQESTGVGVQKQGAIYSTSKKALEDAIAFVGEENVIDYIFGGIA